MSTGNVGVICPPVPSRTTKHINMERILRKSASDGLNPENKPKLPPGAVLVPSKPQKNLKHLSEELNFQSISNQRESKLEMDRSLNTKIRKVQSLLENELEDDPNQEVSSESSNSNTSLKQLKNNKSRSFSESHERVVPRRYISGPPPEIHNEFRNYFSEDLESESQKLLDDVMDLEQEIALMRYKALSLQEKVMWLEREKSGQNRPRAPVIYKDPSDGQVMMEPRTPERIRKRVQFTHQPAYRRLVSPTPIPRSSTPDHDQFWRPNFSTEEENDRYSSRNPISFSSFTPFQKYTEN